MTFVRPLPLSLILAGAAVCLSGCSGPTEKPAVAMQLTAIAEEERAKDPTKPEAKTEPKDDEKPAEKPKREPKTEEETPKGEDVEKPAPKDDKGDEGEPKKPRRKPNPFQRNGQRLLDLPEFPKGLDWLNSKKSLTKKDLEGKLVILVS